jgi:hypothetical protein
LRNDLLFMAFDFMLQTYRANFAARYQ